MDIIHVIIVNYGNTSTSNIAKTLMSLQVKYQIIKPYDCEPEYYTHIILSGGPKHVYQNDSYILSDWIINSIKPVLAICYGMQLLAHTFKGKVERKHNKEYGFILVKDIIFCENVHQDCEMDKYVWMNRYDVVSYVPDKFVVTGYSNDGDIISFTDYKKWWAVQYHPENESLTDYILFKIFLSKK